MEPLGAFVLALFLGLVLIAIIIPQIQKRQETEESEKS